MGTARGLIAAMLCLISGVGIPGNGLAVQQELALQNGLESGGKLFHSIRTFWKTEITDPLARQHVTHALRRLSGALSRVVVEKETLQAAIVDAGATGRFDALPQNAHELRNTLQVLREVLHECLSLFPASRQKEGSSVEAKLHLDLNTPLRSLDDVRRDLSLSRPSVGRAENKLREMIGLTLKMKAEVDGLLTDIQEEIQGESAVSPLAQPSSE